MREDRLDGRQLLGSHYRGEGIVRGFLSERPQMSKHNFFRTIDYYGEGEAPARVPKCPNQAQADGTCNQYRVTYRHRLDKVPHFIDLVNGDPDKLHA